MLDPNDKQNPKDKPGKSKTINRDPISYTPTPRTINIIKSKTKLDPLTSPVIKNSEKAPYETLLSKANKEE